MSLRCAPAGRSSCTSRCSGLRDSWRHIEVAVLGRGGGVSMARARGASARNLSTSVAPASSAMDGEQVRAPLAEDLHDGNIASARLSASPKPPMEPPPAHQPGGAAHARSSRTTAAALTRHSSRRLAGAAAPQTQPPHEVPGGASGAGGGDPTGDTPYLPPTGDDDAAPGSMTSGAVFATSISRVLQAAFPASDAASHVLSGRSDALAMASQLVALGLLTAADVLVLSSAAGELARVGEDDGRDFYCDRLVDGIVRARAAAVAAADQAARPEADRREAERRAREARPPVVGTLHATLRGHTHYVQALVTLADGRLASGSSDGTVRLCECLPHRCPACPA